MGIRARVWYLVANLVRGMWGYRKLWPTTYWNGNVHVSTTASPSRQYIDGFLQTQLPAMLPKKTIRVLDIGCGSGYIRQTLNEAGYRIDYTGVDVKPHKDFELFSPYAEYTNLVLLPAEEFVPSQRYDLVFSVTALEHMENDEEVLRMCRDATDEQGVQVHIIPTFWALFLYLWHGYRQYTPARMRLLFGNTNARTYRVDGAFSFLLHFLAITVPFVLFRHSERIRQTSVYHRLERIAHRWDPYLPFFPSVYVVVVA